MIVSVHRSSSHSNLTKLTNLPGSFLTVLRVHVNQVFQGEVDSIAQIEGLWLIDYANAITIESDDEFDDKRT
nr:S-layer protein domain-containing protein [Methanosarcina horonobensis]